jgi:hypothetical protein
VLLLLLLLLLVVLGIEELNGAGRAAARGAARVVVGALRCRCRWQEALLPSEGRRIM